MNDKFLRFISLKKPMIVKCQKCKEKYERNNVRDYGHPYLCENCLAEGGYKKMKCKLCGKVGEFKPDGFEEHRRFRCPNCEWYMVPWRLRHFGNKYHGYPKWVSEKDWNGRKFAPKMEVCT